MQRHDRPDNLIGHNSSFEGDSRVYVGRLLNCRQPRIGPRHSRVFSCHDRGGLDRSLLARSSTVQKVYTGHSQTYLACRLDTRGFLRSLVQLRSSIVISCQRRKQIWQEGNGIHDLKNIPDNVSVGRGSRPPFDRKMICHNRLRQERRPISSDLLSRPDYIILMDLPSVSGKGKIDSPLPSLEARELTIGPLGKPAPGTVSRRGKGFDITLFLFIPCCVCFLSLFIQLLASPT